MLRLRIYLFFLLLLVDISLFSAASRATVAGFVNLDRSMVSEALSEVERSAGILKKKEGEVVGVQPSVLTIRDSAGSVQDYSIADAKLFVNGRAGTLFALRPVTADCFFQARLYFDCNGKLLLVDGWYIGFEAEIISYADKGGRLYLRVKGLETGEMHNLPVSPVLHDTVAGLCAGDTCYFLLDIDGNIRRISKNS